MADQESAGNGASSEVEEDAQLEDPEQVSPSYVQLPPSPPARFYRKLLEAQRHAPNVKPDKKAPREMGGWPYASTKQILTTLVPELHAAGLCVSCSVLRSHDIETENKKNEIMWMHTAVVEYRLADPDTGYSETWVVEGRSLNKNDQGPNHAIQAAWRIFLPALLNVTTDEGGADPPTETAVRQGREPEPRQRTERIPHARGIRFRKEGDTWWREDTGEYLVTCPKCKAFPMIELDADFLLCVDATCKGEYTGMDAEIAVKKLTERNGDDEKKPPNASEEFSRARAAFEDLWKRNHWFPWQFEAITGAEPSLPTDRKLWGLEDYDMVLKKLRKHGATYLMLCAKKCAEEVPAADDRINLLRDLCQKEGAPLQLRATAEEAIRTGWHDAVEAMIERLSENREQIELPAGK